MRQLQRITLTLLALTVCLAAAADKHFYIAPNGDDTWTGARKKPNPSKTDGPFATLERARDAAREFKTERGLPRGSIEIVLIEGDYLRAQSFDFSAEDSGTLKAPITYRARRGATVRLIGGVALPAWAPVTDSAILARIPENARAEIRVADLSQLEDEDLGSPGALSPAPAELIVDGAPQTVARWPNDAWLRIPENPDDLHGPILNYKNERPARWTTAPDPWLQGFFYWNWADFLRPIDRIDPDAKTITVRDDFGGYGSRKGQHYYAFNLLEELDQPGEYYIDRAAKRIYAWFPAGSSAVLSTLAGPLVKCDGASHLRFEDITFMDARGNGAVVDGGKNVTFVGCTFANLGSAGVRINSGEGHTVESCDMYDVGQGGIYLNGGDRKSLTPGNHAAVNNRIYRYGRRKKTYSAAVHVNGVGHRVAHNLFYDAPHVGILLGGNDHIIEYNEFTKILLTTSDAGAFYLGRDWTEQGNVVRYNYFHEMPLGDVTAIYLDDWASGVTIRGNIVERVGRGILIGGGRDNLVENNIFVENRVGVHIDARGLGWASNYFDGTTTTLFDRFAAMNAAQPPFATRYPQLATLLDDEPVLPKYNRIERNIFVGNEEYLYRDRLIPEDMCIGFSDNKIDEAPEFRDPDNGDYRLRRNSPEAKIDFKDIPVNKIGLYRDRHRNNLPNHAWLKAYQPINKPAQFLDGSPASH